MTDVIPLGERQFMVRLFAVPVLPERIGADLYYEGLCRITWKDGRSDQKDCILHRPGLRRNAFGIQAVDHLILVLRTGVSQAELAAAGIEVAQWGAEISEEAVKAKLRRP